MTDDQSNGHHARLAEKIPADVGRKAVRRKQDKTKAALKKQGADRKRKGYVNEKHTDLMAFNAGAEHAFIQLVRELLEEEEGKGRNTIPITEVIREGAYELKVSPQTVKRYLMKYSARKAPFRVFGDQVLLNPNYVPDEEPEEEASDEDAD